MNRLPSIISILIMSASLAMISCSNSGDGADAEMESYGFAYDLTAPDADYELHDDLDEISGISWYSHNKLACIQDEKGIIYLFDEVTGEITGSYPFARHGDYEDIAIYHDTAWVLKSNGTIYKVTNFAGSGRETFIIPTALSTRNDTEGMAYDIIEKVLLIACKNVPSIDEKEKFDGFRAIYHFGANDNKLEEKPEYLIDTEWFNNSTENTYFKRVSLSLARKLQLAKNNVFNPSGLAIHPLKGDLYVISAFPGKLIVMKRDGSVSHIKTLDKRIFRQPEGISFSSEGDLYISNEGINGRGNILKFKYQP
ncbi:MAG: hypothetical protein RBT38_13800 [Bacteroidales bacterium]|nr:hypothetical protein [Bacteroidales bacterium]